MGFKMTKRLRACCFAILASSVLQRAPAQPREQAPPLGSAAASSQARNLRGLKKLRLTILLGPGADDLGFFEAKFRTSVELSLRKVGIKIVPDDTREVTPHMGVLIAPFKIGSTEVVVTNISVFVYASARIEQNNVRGLVAIWSPWAEFVFAPLADTTPAEK